MSVNKLIPTRVKILPNKALHSAFRFSQLCLSSLDFSSEFKGNILIDCSGQKSSNKTLRIRFAALPSQYRGEERRFILPADALANSFTIRCGSEPTRTLVPFSRVTGLSVLCLKVMHGTPRIVVSSCIPPESVRTTFASDIKDKKSKYPNGGIKRILTRESQGSGPSIK